MVYLNMFRFPADTLMPLLEDDAREGTSSTIDLLPHGSRTTEQSTSPPGVVNDMAGPSTMLADPTVPGASQEHKLLTELTNTRIYLVFCFCCHKSVVKCHCHVNLSCPSYRTCIFGFCLMLIVCNHAD